jgi:hypothetical protein
MWAEGLAKAKVAGSNPVFRSNDQPGLIGGNAGVRAFSFRRGGRQ